jgi:hypothetical protein
VKTGTTWALTLSAAFVISIGVGALTATGEEQDAKRPLSAYWMQQTSTDCGLMAARAVIGDRTGLELTEAQVEATAFDVYGWTPGEGTPWSKVDDLLAAYHVDAYVADDMSMGSLEKTLASGADVIVAVQSGTLWAAEGLEGQAEGTPQDHAVAVESMDADGVVVVDSAWDGGKAAKVSAAAFEAAWWANGSSASVVVPAVAS